MGRTNPTFRDVVRTLEDRWQPFRRALRYEDQERFDRLLTHARNHADAAGNLNHQSPVIPVLVAIAVAQERLLDELEARVEETTATADDISIGMDSR
jgi:predicted phage gp36 major capsid-like protein